MEARRGVSAFVATATVVAVAMVAPVLAVSPVAISVSGNNGTGSIDSPGLSCDDGGTGESRSFRLDSPLDAGVLSSLPGAVRTSIDVHIDPDLAPLSGGHNAFLISAKSRTAVANDRGVISATLAAAGPAGAIGLCPIGALDFDPASLTVAGSGTWTVQDSLGSYEGATGSGTFNLTARLGPGAANPWSLDLQGSIAVRQPALEVTTVRAFWDRLGTDYLSRIVSVQLRVSNVGAGDAYGAHLLQAASPTPGVTALGPVPQPLGDIPAGESSLVTVRYRLGLFRPCLVVLGCDFTVRATVSLPDALDVATTFTDSTSAHAPELPPPL